MPLSFEMFATGSAAPADLWAVVGDPTRLHEWTDARQVQGPTHELLEGDEVVVVLDGDVTQKWTIVTAGERIWEAHSVTPAGALGFGARVVDDPHGSRLVLACTLQPSGSRLRAKVFTMPRLRGRCDRWSAAALRVARGRL